MPGHRGQVARLTAGDRTDADPVVRPGHRRQLAAQQLGEPLHGRPDRLGDMDGGRVPDSGLRGLGRLEQGVGRHRQGEVALQVADGVIDAHGGRRPPGRGLRQVPLPERVERGPDLRQPGEVTPGRLGTGDGHGGHRLEDEPLPADITLRRRVRGPQRVLGVGPGALDQGRQHPVVEPLVSREVSLVDLAGLAADGREFLLSAFARLPARVEGQPVELLDAEQRGVVRVVAVLRGEVRLTEPGEVCGGAGGIGHVPSSDPAGLPAAKAR